MSTAKKFISAAIKTVKNGEINKRLKNIAELPALREQLHAQRDKIAELNEKVAGSSSLLDVLSYGLDIETALVEYARNLGKAERPLDGRGFVHRLVDDPKYNYLGSLVYGVYTGYYELYAASRGYFLDAGEDLAVKRAPYEYFDSFLHQEPEAALAKIQELLGPQRASTSQSSRIGILQALAKYHHWNILRTETAKLVAEVAEKNELTETEFAMLQWFKKRLLTIEPKIESKPGVINFGVMDYKLIERKRTSGNRGDYVQTLAALSNLLRFENVEYVGDTELSNYMNGLISHVHEDRKIKDVSARVQPVAIDRDFASGREYPENTWLILNGWFMHRAFRGPVDFPFPQSVNPIMISFHIQDVDVLTPVVVDRLKQLEPIGCRDWTTVYRLRDHGVKAFFSGCVTTTVGQVLKPNQPSGSKRLAVVETRLKPGAYKGWATENFIQVGDYVKDFGLVEGIEDARNMLNLYAPFNKVATSRLHCYLPARSMGLPVEFAPKNKADIRFEGLLNLDENAFNAIRHGIEEKLEVMLRAILAGKSRAEVMQLWREITAADVAAADAYCANSIAPEASGIDLVAAANTMRANSVSFGNKAPNAIEVAFALDQNLKDIFKVVLQSILEKASRPVHAHVLMRGLDKEYFKSVAELFPEFSFKFYDCSDVSYGDNLKLLSHISVSTIDRLLLPELLTDLDKILYLDTDILVLDDIAKLHDIELGDKVLGGKSTNLYTWASLIKPMTRASLQLPFAKAWNMRRYLHAHGKLTTRSFNAGVILMNLKAMRAEKATATQLALVERWKFNDQDALNYYAAGRVVELGQQWNTVPAQDFTKEPSIIHWAGPAKPWKEMYVLYKPLWQAVNARLQAKIK